MIARLAAKFPRLAALWRAVKLLAKGKPLRQRCPDCGGDGLQVHPMDTIERARVKGKAWSIYPHRIRVRECPKCNATGYIEP